MKCIKNKHIKCWLVPALLATAIASASHANTVDEPVQAVTPEADPVQTQPVASQEVAEPKFLVLSDKLHHVQDALTAKHPVHYYGFVAERGQDVLLYSPDAVPSRKNWIVEYFENGKWVVQDQQRKVFSGLQPKAELIIRITPRNPAGKTHQVYNLSFGSYPVLKSYDLHDEPGVIRIPSGRTEPSWLATQIYKEALLEVKFTDTKGAALQGVTADFSLVMFEHEIQKPITHSLVSDTNGLASKRIELGRCYGGIQAEDFEHRQQGFNIWRSHYKVGGYTITNQILTAPDNKPHVFYLGHICTQKVLKTVPFRN